MNNRHPHHLFSRRALCGACAVIATRGAPGARVTQPVLVTRAALAMTQAMGCRRIPSRCRARRARRGPPAGGCPAQRGVGSSRWAAGRRSRRHEQPIRRRARARSSRTEAACGAAIACCTRYTTTLRRLLAAFSFASSDVEWTTELPSPAGFFLVMPSFARLPSPGRANRPSGTKWREIGR